MQTAPARPAEGEPRGSRLSPDAPLILVVDDEPAVSTALRYGLRELGYRVDVSASADEARGRLRSRRYDLILCDYAMPGATGLDLLGYVSQVHPEVPFILFTGLTDPDLACSAITFGAIDFIPKPFELRELARVIEQNRARAERDRARAAEATHAVLTGTIRALVAAVDAKDPHTASHSARVTDLALRLGNAMELSHEDISILEFAALLHDVGKIGVPDEILRKPAALTVEEWGILRQHPVRSAEIVGQVGELREVVGIVRHHHERVDGTGYPDGLVGEAIPLLARVIAVADAYEAMTSDRAYRSALTPAQAREEMRRGLGGQFDAALGEVFLLLTDLP